MKKISESRLILYTAVLVIVAGIIRFISYSLGTVLFYLAFAPYLLYRFIRIIKKKKELRTTLDSYRTLLFFLMVFTISLNIAGWQEADFFLLFLIMIDYLLVINKKF